MFFPNGSAEVPGRRAGRGGTSDKKDGEPEREREIRRPGIKGGRLTVRQRRARGDKCGMDKTGCETVKSTVRERRVAGKLPTVRL